MRRTAAVVMWDVAILVSVLFLIPFLVAAESGRGQAAEWYAGIWMVIVLVALVTGHLRGYSLGRYLTDLRNRQSDP
jgi:hypothetical protein